jgi:hypothetical protein
MGFRRLRVFNEALLAKQGWRLITHPNSLVAQILKAKYYHKEHLLKAKAKPNMSYTWRSIDLLTYGMTIGSTKGATPPLGALNPLPQLIKKFKIS